MGELVVGKPTFQLNSTSSSPLDFVSVLALLYRSVPGSGLHPELQSARRELPRDIVEDLDLLHGFTGRLLYYMEEPLLIFDPFAAEHRNAPVDDLIASLSMLPPEAFKEMAVRALQRVHADLGTGLLPPDSDDQVAWRDFILPALTTASPDETLTLLSDPVDLKNRTVRLMETVWEGWYQPVHARNRAILDAATTQAQAVLGRGFGIAFTELTGNRLPSTLVSRLNDVEAVTFVPSSYVSNFISFTSYGSNLVVYFGAPEYLARQGHRMANGNDVLQTLPALGSFGGPLANQDLLEGFNALGDMNRLRILDLLLEGELYAQEIVGRLGIAQSAVSRHLSLLERSSLISVRPKGGMKYYAIDSDRLDELAAVLCTHCHK